MHPVPAIIRLRKSGGAAGRRMLQESGGAGRPAAPVPRGGGVRGRAQSANGSAGGAADNSTTTVFTCVYSCSTSRPFSRPMPLIL